MGRSWHRRLAVVLTLLAALVLVPAAQAQGSAASITLKLSPPLISADGVSQTTATGTTGVSGEFVVITSSDPNQTFSPDPAQTNNNGTYTSTITASTTPGPSTITATDLTTGAQATAQLRQFGPASSISIISIAPPSIPANGASTAAVTAYVSDSAGDPVPGHSVGFSSNDPGETISGATDNGDGTYSARVAASMTPGTASIIATDSTAGLTSAPQFLTQTASSGTTFSVLPSTTVSTNQPVTLIAAVAGSPTGTITFYSGFSPIAGCQGLSVSSSNPVAVCQLAFMASGSPLSLTAAFVPASGSGGSSQGQTVNVVAGATTTSIGASAPSARVGIPITYTAFVSPGNQGPATPGGSVQFVQGGKPLAHCSSVPVRASGGGGTASCSVKYRTPGMHSVMAVYTGDQNFGRSSSGTLHVPVQALGRINAAMLWNFLFTSTFTKVTSMSVNGVSLGTKVIITCHGDGCPFANHVITLSGGTRCTPTGKHHCGPHSRGPVNLTPAFRSHRLVVGTKVTVEIRRPGWIGKFYSFLMRSGRRPQIRINCLAPGLSRPGIAC
jgi:Bacterial Ig-like domain (group 3)/Invasin, domain 3